MTPLWLAKLVCRWFGHRFTDWIDGRAALALYRGEVRFCRRCVFCETRRNFKVIDGQG